MSFTRRFITAVLFSAALAPQLLAQTPTADSSRLVQPAQVEPYERASIVAKASGFVKAVHVDIGDIVEKGDLLAELSIPEMQKERLQKEALVEQAGAEIRQAEAAVTSASAKIAAAKSQSAAAKAQLQRYSADIDFARSEFDRITTLVNSRTINASMKDEKLQKLRSAEAAMSAAQADVSSADSLILVAEANLKQKQADVAYAQSQRKVAEASLAHTNTLMEYASIRAPFDGKISHRGIDTGDFVMSAASAKGEALFTLNRADRLRIVFDVPESAAALIELGQRVELKLDSLKNQIFVGNVKRTAGQLDKRTRTLRVEAEVEDKEQRLSPGMYGMVTTTVSQK